MGHPNLKEFKSQNRDSEDEYSDEEKDSEDDGDQSDEDQSATIADLSHLVRCFPSTLEGFSFTSKSNDVLENRYKFEKFIKVLMEFGIQSFSFNKINFLDANGHKNLETFSKIFSEPLANSKIKNVRFHESPGVEKLDGVFGGFSTLKTLSFTRCNISGNVHQNNCFRVEYPRFSKYTKSFQRK